MIDVKNPYKKEALIEAAEKTHQGVTAYFTSLATEAFFKKILDKWSAAENLVHLIKSVKAVSTGMKLPKMIIGLKFGKSERNSRIYPQIREIYLSRLAEGAVSLPQFRPDDRQQPTNPEASREQILKKWDEIHRKFVSVLTRWGEKDLDRYILPHPILGNLTVREMVMFTIYHNIHHMTNVKKFLGEEQLGEPA